MGAEVNEILLRDVARAMLAKTRADAISEGHDPETESYAANVRDVDWTTAFLSEALDDPGLQVSQSHRRLSVATSILVVASRILDQEAFRSFMGVAWRGKSLEPRTVDGLKAMALLMQGLRDDHDYVLLVPEAGEARIALDGDVGSLPLMNYATLEDALTTLVGEDLLAEELSTFPLPSSPRP